MLALASTGDDACVQAIITQARPTNDVLFSNACRDLQLLPAVPHRLGLYHACIWIHGVRCASRTSREGAVAPFGEQAHAACHRQPCLPSPKGTTQAAERRSSSASIMQWHVV